MTPAVLGSTMSRSLASRVLDRPDLVAAETWERELGDLVVVDEASVRFRHDLVRVAAYEGLSIRRRRAVHRRAGDVIEAWDDSVPMSDPVSALAFHATGSGLQDRIIRWNGEAAEAAMAKGAMEIAESLLAMLSQRNVRSAPMPKHAAIHIVASRSRPSVPVILSPHSMRSRKRRGWRTDPSKP